MKYRSHHEDDESDYPRRRPRWSGCGEYPGCGADDCPTCRPGCDQSGDDDDAPAPEEAEETQPLSTTNFPAAPQLKAMEEPEQSFQRPSIG